MRPDAPVQLLFTGHMDTVFGADHAFQETRWLEDGVLNGPGVADMKGGIAVMLAALKAVEASAAPTASATKSSSTATRKSARSASAALIAEAARGKRAALTYEPAALPDGTLAGARPGSGNFAFVIHGRSAHAGRNPEDGRNALARRGRPRTAAVDGEAQPGLSVNPARIDGGVADQCRSRPRHPARQLAARDAGRPEIAARR